MGAAHVPQEKLGEKVKVTSAIPAAYLAWARGRWPDADARLAPRLQGGAADLVGQPIATNTGVLFRDLIQLARAIAAVDGGEENALYRELGRHSARLNMAGAYDAFNEEMPHHFFSQMDYLHRSFQSFGRSEYAPTGARAGRIRIEGYPEYSPVYCISGMGYYEQALAMMKAPGPVSVDEAECQCRGHSACVFDVRW